MANLSALLRHEWVIAILVGLIGGIFDSILTGGFAIPRIVPGTGGRRVMDPGFLGNILVGGGAGFASWALNTEAKFADMTIDVGPIAASFLAGVGGGEVLSGFVRRQFLEGTSEQTATALQTALAREQTLREEVERLRGG